jgi:hypothetical protein
MRAVGEFIQPMIQSTFSAQHSISKEIIMTTRTLLLTETDHRHLSELVEDTRRGRFEDAIYVE